MFLPARALIWIGCLFALEAGLRVWHGLPLLPDRNLIAERSELTTAQPINVFDPLLGWVLAPGTRGSQADPHSSFTTCDYGTRANAAGACPNPLPLGVILAVGDSFTAGSEVGDAETWPAALGQTLGQPVINAATGGWGSDQIVLRAEQLRDLLRPRAVVVSFLDQDILRAGFGVYGGGSKPWFTVASAPAVPGEEHASPPALTGLVAHNIPVERHPAVGASLGALRRLLGYSHAADALAMRWAPSWWLQPPSGYVTVYNDPAEVSCLLLKRLRPTLLVLQWGGNEVTAWPKREDGNVPAVRVLDCARASGIPTLDLWDGLKAELAAGRLESLFNRQPDGNPWGHMSPAGNEWVARLIAAALGA